MQQALTFTISHYMGMYFIFFLSFCFKLLVLEEKERNM